MAAVVTFLLGATGVGKSEVALELARLHGAAILAMDAMQVYRGASVGVSKPSAEERAEIPHGGLDLVEFGESFDVARYVEHATAFLAEQERAGRPVLIVGGTGLFFRVLTQGLCDAPAASPGLRDELSALSVEELRSRLARVDPAMLARLDAENPRRLMRAIAVMESTGRSLAAWQKETPPATVREYRAWWLQRSKAELDARIEARVEAMFAAGWVEEVRELIAQHGIDQVKAFPGIGYREIAAALVGRNRIDTGSLHRAKGAPSGHPLPVQQLSELKAQIGIETRQYAKRQLTWFRREPNLKAVILSGAPPILPAPFSI